MTNYATKADLKNTAGVDTSSFAKKTDLAHVKSDVDKLDIDKLKCLPTNLNNLKSKVNKLHVDKLAPFPAALSKISNVVILHKLILSWWKSLSYRNQFIDLWSK